MTEYKHNIPEERIIYHYLNIHDALVEQENNFADEWLRVCFYDWTEVAWQECVDTDLDVNTVCIWRVKEDKLKK